MVGLYKDPKGEDIFKNTSGIKSLNTTRESEGTENEVHFQQKIKDLEDQVKQKNVCVCPQVCMENLQT